MRDRARSFSLPRPWWSSFGLCGIVQESRDLPGRERKEGIMIRILAQIILRQVGALKGRRLHEADPLPLLDAATKEAAYVSGARSQVPAPLPDKVEPDASMWPEPLAQSLLDLLTVLVQRRVQAALTKEDIHEYDTHHDGSSRANGLRLRSTIDA